MKGIVFNLQRYSLHDGPGIRTTVFLKGCPARCWWCHNPESQSSAPEVACSLNRCIRCDACLYACHEKLEPRTVCRVCGECAEACPTGARETVGRETYADEVVQSVLKDRFFFEDSGGGVTFSGGEPLCQPEFLKELLKGCRDHGIHTAVDTAGLCPASALLEVAPLVDLFLYDLKCAGSERHREGTGIDNGQILENLERLGRVHENIWLRVPVVPGFNDSAEEMETMAEIASRARGVRQLWLLPYHGSWTAKPARFGKEAPPPVAVAAPPGGDAMEDFARIFRGRGLDTRTGGV